MAELNMEQDKRMRELGERIEAARREMMEEEDVCEGCGEHESDDCKPDCSYQAKRRAEVEEEEEEDRFLQEVAGLARDKRNLQEEVAGLVVEKEQFADKIKRLIQEVCGHLADKANLLEKVRALERELETEKNKYKRGEAIFSQVAEANEATIQDYLNKNLKLISELKEKDKCCITPVCLGATHANWCDECIKKPGRSQHASYPFKRI